MGRKRKRRQKEQDESTSPSLPLTPEMAKAIEDWAMEAAEVHELELFDVDVSARGRWIVKVFVDIPDAEPGSGISVGALADVSRYLEAVLDADEGVPEKYVLEVSSPGIERPLKKPRHFEQVVGRDVELVLREPVLGKNKIIGRLLAKEDGVLTINFEEEVLKIDLDTVARAKLKFDFSEHE